LRVVNQDPIVGLRSRVNRAVRERLYSHHLHYNEVRVPGLYKETCRLVK